MKVNSTTYNGRKQMSIADAVIDASTPNAYSYEGQLEKLSQENEKLRELVGRLINSMCDGGMPAYALQEVLGYGYEVEE